MAWRAGSNGDAAATSATTWRQQASRAFAAELLAPAALLKERAGKTGLTRDTLQRLANEWMCPQLAIIHQAENHKIPLKGVDRALHNY
jgi:Zn-dependent peptidase ImmA (M78 family)